MEYSKVLLLDCDLLVRDDIDHLFTLEAPASMHHGIKCGLLKKHMYGIMAAADGWQQEYSSFLRGLGFVQGEACPCLFVCAERELALSVHGDDFTTVGPKCELDVFEQQLESKYELKRGGRLGN